MYPSGCANGSNDAPGAKDGEVGFKVVDDGCCGRGIVGKAENCEFEESIERSGVAQGLASVVCDVAGAIKVRLPPICWPR